MKDIINRNISNVKDEALSDKYTSQSSDFTNETSTRNLEVLQVILLQVINYMI